MACDLVCVWLRVWGCVYVCGSASFIMPLIRILLWIIFHIFPVFKATLNSVVHEEHLTLYTMTISKTMKNSKFVLRLFHSQKDWAGQ